MQARGGVAFQLAQQRLGLRFGGRSGQGFDVPALVAGFNDVAVVIEPMRWVPPRVLAVAPKAHSPSRLVDKQGTRD